LCPKKRGARNSGPDRLPAAWRFQSALCIGSALQKCGTKGFVAVLFGLYNRNFSAFLSGLLVFKNYQIKIYNQRAVPNFLSAFQMAMRLLCRLS
jgi:hypothetical protein